MVCSEREAQAEEDALRFCLIFSFSSPQWREALDALIASREAESREIIAISDRAFHHLRGNALAAVREGQDELVSQAVTSLRKLRNEDMDELQDKLLNVESSTVDAISELVSEFDRCGLGVASKGDGEARALALGFERIEFCRLFSGEERVGGEVPDPQRRQAVPPVTSRTYIRTHISVSRPCVRASLCPRSNYTEMVDSSKGIIAAFFTQIRDLENAYYDRVMQQAASLIERAAATAEAEDGGGFTDDARGILSDKESLNNSLQASHDSHLSAIDGAEDRLVSEEVRRYTTLLAETRTWENQRNRDRISEIMGLVERWRDRVDAVLAELEATNAIA